MAVASSSVVADYLGAQAPVSAPLDAAAEYLRSRMDRVLPLYVLAMAPHAVASIVLIDAIIAEHRSVIPRYCIYLVAATLWRWLFLARLQLHVEQDLHSQRDVQFWSKIGPILLLRAWGNFAMVWGSVLAGVPTFYGLYVGSFATPLLINSSEPLWTRLRQSLSWIHGSGRRLFRILVAMTAIAVLLVVAIFAGQSILANTILPSILGVDTAELNVTFDSWAWRLRVLYFIFLLLDMFWTIASVILFYDSQSRRMATDLRAMLLAITEGLA